MPRTEESPGSARGGRRALAGVLGLGVVIGLANLTKAVHIDDTLYLTIARRIVTHPLDPYGGILNWQQIPEPTYNVSISPPLLSYYFALVILAGSEDGILLHASMIPWLLVACWALFRLGERWAGAGGATATLVVVAPAVVVGMNLMLDVPLLACMAAAVELLARGLEGRSPIRSYVLAGTLAAMGLLVKLPALALVPAFVVAAWTHRRWAPLLVALGPLGALAAWQVISRSIYGTSQVSSGFSFLRQLQPSQLVQTCERVVTMAAILAMSLPLWAAVPFQKARQVVPLLGAVATAGLAAWLLGRGPSSRSSWVTWAFVAASGLGAFGLLATLVPARSRNAGGARAGRGGDPRPVLFVWIAAGAALVILFGPFVAVRSFLPIHPPLAILLIRSLATPARRRAGVAAMAVVSAAMSGPLAYADYRWAGCYPTATLQIREQYGGGGRPIGFLGHWGWQYYAERAGFQPWDARRLDAPTGTLLVVPLRADKQFIHPIVVRRLRPLSRITIPPNPLDLTTWNRRAGIRFYGGDYGEIPWGFSAEPTEWFDVLEVGPP